MPALQRLIRILGPAALATLALAAPLLAGCADIRAAREAQDPASAGPGERTVAAEEIGLGPGSTLTLERGLELTIQYNPSVALARRSVDAARARLRQAKSGFYPQVSAGGGADASGRKGVHGVDESFSASASADILLYDFGRTDALHRQAALNLAAAGMDFRNAEIEAAFAFRQAFYDVLKQIELVGIAEQTVRQFEKRLEQVRSFVEVGTRVKYDLTKAQVDLGNAQLGLVRARTALAVQQAVLGNTLGLAQVPAYALEKPAEAEEAAPAAEALMGTARQNHPRLLAQAVRVRAASAAVDAAVADLFPELGLRGSISASGAMTPVDWAWSAGPALNWLVFGGWARLGQVNESVAGLQASRASRAQAEQEVFLDIQRALAAREDARQSHAILALTVRQAEENLDLVEGRYAAGKASSVEVTDAQVTLATTRGQKVQAEYDARIAAAQLKRAAGAPPVPPKGKP